jgi:bifunctional non-homologous end joining protein LigD
MLQIAAGKGEGPSPFMRTRRKAAKPDDVWHSTSTDDAPPPRPIPRRRGTLKITPVKADGGAVLGITISKPEKVLWPAGDEKPVTKRQLAEYLATVGPWMIEHVRGRPCSLLRAPDGIDGQIFFQRHAMSGTSELVDTVKAGGDHEPYLQIDEVDGLVAMGQLAALEFHPWNCAPFRLAVPGRLIFDLDPAPDVPFPAVVDEAKELRERLEAIGLIAFCKTTGGKGLHVVAPLKVMADDALGWDEAKMFAQAVSAQMAQDSPSKYLTKMTKKLRTGRIFLDYLRNDRIATAVAPLSPRARPGATVSMPLTWSQMRSDLDPKRFTVHSVPALLAKTSAWKEYGAAERPLRAAIGKLVGKAR